MPVYYENAQYRLSKEYADPIQSEAIRFNGELLWSKVINFQSRSYATQDEYRRQEVNGALALRSEKRAIVLSTSEGTLVGLEGALVNDTHIKQCIYCEAKLVGHADFGVRKSFNDRGYHYQLLELLMTCPVCRWWFHTSAANYWVSSRMNGTQENEAHRTLNYGRLRTYDVKARKAPMHELRSWLKEHRTNLATVNPTVLDEVIADSFEGHLPGAEVTTLGSVRDTGIDVKLVANENEALLLQIKKSESSPSANCVEVVRELNGLLVREGAVQGMVITGEHHFPAGIIEGLSPRAKSLVRYNVELRAFDDPVELLRCGRRDGRPVWYEDPANLDALPYHSWVTNFAITEQSVEMP